MINWIQDWYKSQCDGNWEHTNGVRIETLDNPGWSIEIDFNNTDLKINDISWKLFEISDDSWIGYSIKNNIFSSSSDPLKLNLMISLFKKIVEEKKLEDGYVYSQLRKVS